MDDKVDGGEGEWNGDTHSEEFAGLRIVVV